MKKLVLFAALLLFVFSSAYSQHNLSYFQIGSFNPKATDAGLILCFGTAKMVDERVELGVSLDMFTKRSEDEEEIATEIDPSGTVTTTISTNFESTVYMFPLMAYTCINFPVEFPVTPYITGAIGYTFLWNSYDNYVTNEGETNYFGGFCYRFGVGGLYPLGSRSAFVAEVFYNSSKPSHKEDIQAGVPTRTEVDMSGMGFRIGLKFGGVGFF